ncbi:hypothetical protein ACSBOB_01585 [Mesorhizobium sp. ASY16-5R]|uniref:hypothetical protein n=1 Tax=Mesorhizobium sp. ASY16-5R TaxID=3445772 RepID=UPI003FA082B5
MADVTITAANVIAGAGAEIEHGTAGATETSGQALYRDAADSRLKVSDNDGTAAARKVRGLALNSAANGQPMAIIRRGPVTIGGTLVAGTTYCLSSTPGAICPQADVASGDDVVIIGVAMTTAILNVAIQHPGVTLG